MNLTLAAVMRETGASGQSFHYSEYFSSQTDFVQTCGSDLKHFKAIEHFQLCYPGKKIQFIGSCGMLSLYMKEVVTVESAFKKAYQTFSATLKQ